MDGLFLVVYSSMMRILRENGSVGLCGGGFERLGGWCVIGAVVVILDGHWQSLTMKNGWSFVKAVCSVWTMLESWRQLRADIFVGLQGITRLLLTRIPHFREVSC